MINQECYCPCHCRKFKIVYWCLCGTVNTGNKPICPLRTGTAMTGSEFYRDLEFNQECRR